MSDTPASRRPRLRWHRRLGLAAAAVFVVVALTGLALNHSLTLGLQKRVLEADWLYRWYGMQPTGEPIAYALPEGRHLIGLGGSLFVDERPIGSLSQLRGAANLGSLFAAAGPREIMLLQTDGTLVERLSGDALPPGEIFSIGALSVSEGQTRLAVVTAVDRFAFDEELVSWHRLGADIVLTSTPPVQLPNGKRGAVVRAYRGDGLTLYRVMLDLHSGRFFGQGGVLAVDLSAFALLFLTFTGVYYAWRTRR